MKGQGPPEGGIYYSPEVYGIRAEDGTITIWHDCATIERWIESGIGLHEQHTNSVARLTLRPSLYWNECCGLHGWLTQGLWLPV